eukprot:5526141-Heterocapsa_arctica.AAC.1
MNPLCLDCNAKLKSQPARRVKRADPELDSSLTEFGDLVAMDHIIMRGPDAGLQGEKAGFLIADVATENMSFAPMRKKTFQLCTQALRDFSGPDD